ncbi:MAG: phosphomannomutase/phosphoglucomutase [Firmicutes bacterium]|nr:phosphomannomutase/phosphoglucomutase [Bacillota bacterium]
MPAVNPGIFREYDVRGIVGKDLTPDVVRVLGRGFGAYLLEARRAQEPPPGTPGNLTVLLGRDNRLSSDGFADAFSQGLLEAGYGVRDIGMVLTPMLYYSRIAYGIDGAVMITGSHNPPDFNGFKLCRGPGTIYGEEIQELRRIIERGEFAAPGRGPTTAATSAATDAAVPRREAVDLAPAYRGMLMDKISLGPRRLKVVVDCGSGTASLFAPQVLRDWGCDVIPLYCTSDPTYPHHHPDPVKPENLRDLQRAVREYGADLGIAFDGDGDRIGAVDEQGNILWGDILMALFWREILPKRPGTPAIVEVKCSQALVEEIERLGGRPIFYKTGHSLIKAKMRELEAVFTGEMSGHMFFADEYYGFDDAIYAAGRLLRILSNTDETLSRLVSTIPRYHSTPEIRVDCPEEAKFRVVEAVKADFQGRFPVIDVDGARVLFPDGWGLVRASNTQPVLVVRCEAKTQAGLEKIQSQMMGVLEHHPEVGPIRWD